MILTRPTCAQNELIKGSQQGEIALPWLLAYIGTIDFPQNLALILFLVMTKKDMLNLLSSVDSMEAGAAISFVKSLEDNDPRFETSFEGKTNAAIGFWQREENARQGEFIFHDQKELL